MTWLGVVDAAVGGESPAWRLKHCDADRRHGLGVREERCGNFAIGSVIRLCEFIVCVPCSPRVCNGLASSLDLHCLRPFPGC